MGFITLGVKVDTSQVAPATQGAVASVAKMEDAADQATAALGKLGPAGAKAGKEVAAGMEDAASSVGATGEKFGDFFDRLDREQRAVLQRIKGPWEQYQADLRATNALFEQNKLSTIEYEAEAARLATRLESLQRLNLTPQLKLEADMLDGIVGPLKRYEQELAALDALLRAEQITLEQYDAALAKVQRRAESSGALTPTQGPAFNPGLAGLASGPLAGPAYDPTQAGKGVSEELKRELDILKQIQAPMKEYEAQLAALDALLKRNDIDLETYNRELEKVQKTASRGLGPVQGPRQQTPGAATSEPTEHGGRGAELIEAVAPKLGAAGDILGGLATKGTIAAAAVVALGVELVHLGDEYIVLYNKAQKVTDAGGSINDTLEEQLGLSKQLHGSLEATIELYDAVRDGTDELNLSQRQQVNLAKEIGQAVLAEGKSIESAEGLMKRLTYAFASGAISGRDMKSIMREFPDIGAAFVTTMGHSRNELVAMANKGQISAEILIDSFRKMNKEMAEKVDKQIETSGQKWQHFKDAVLIGIPRVTGETVDALGEMAHASAVANAQIEAGITIDTEAIAQQRAAARATRERAEATRLLSGEKERNAKTASLANVANQLGIDFGPFDEEHANKVAALRIQMSQLGIETEDVFEKAHGKAALFGRKLEEIQEREDAKKIAEDVQRIYNALHGADDLLDKQMKQWHDIADQAKTAAEAAAKFKANPPPGVPQPQRDQMQRDLDLAAKNAATAQTDTQYGKGMVSYAQGISSARAELEALNRAARDGVISGEALRQKQHALLTTLNDGRLPEAIKIMEGIHLPIDQAARDMAALNALFNTGRVSVEEYTTELKKIADTHKNDDAAILENGIARLDQRFAQGLLTLRTYDEAVKQLTVSFATLHKTSSGIAYRIAPEGPSVPAGLLPQAQQQLYAPSVTGSDEMRKILAQTRSEALTPASGNAEGVNLQLERAKALTLEFVAPAVKYENTLKDIDVALNTWGLTEEQATALRRRAKDAMNSELEALEAQKGPMEAYEAALRKLKDQYEAGDISAKKYANGVDAAKVAMLEATGQADTFSGAMQIEWVKMQHEAEAFGATIASLAVNDFSKLNDAIVSAANDSAVSWSQMADAMIQDLERVALKMAEIGLIKGIISAFGSGGGGGGLADTGIGMEGWGGYATGGSFLVGGSGGTDTTPVGFMATPGERVTVSPPGAYPYPSAGVGGGSGSAYAAAPATVVHVHNHYDSAISQAALDGPGGQKSVVNTLRLNAGAVRTLTSKPRRA